jgi:Transposase IS66 family
MAERVSAQDLAGLGAGTDPAVFLNLIERLMARVQVLEEELGRARDEINRLKGEQGRPGGLTKKRQRAEHSSDRERREAPKSWHKGAKLPEIAIDRQVACRLDPADLPQDARLKDHVEITVQDVVLRTDNVRFRCERWYAESTGTTYQAPLPAGYEGEFGPGLKALALTLAYGSNMGQAQIRQLFTSVGVRVSAGYLAGLLTDTADFAPEAQAVGVAGLAQDGYAHLDVTPTRVAGVEQECHVLGNTAFVFYHTDLFRDRQAALRALQLGAETRFQVNEVAWAFLATGARLAASTRTVLETMPPDRRFTQPEWYGWLDTNLPWLGPQQRQRLSDAAAVGAYQVQTAVPIVDTLVCDDAPTFKGLTEDLQLCWVHEGRHYKKLTPVISRHQALLAAFLGEFWTYYRRLRAYQQAPTAPLAAVLARDFATLFSRQTGYADLDARLAKTTAKRQALLRVLEKPYLPLHNNPAELAARRRVRKRDASFSARSPAGIRAWDVFHTLIGTASLLGVNVLHYFRDRCSRASAIPALADLIRQRPEQAAAVYLAAA